ncbi:MAG TPA: efflux transporter outer membrane subunit [Burkholderiaceae bacterium]|nr:efflux transporter outer membrane subunit [Burkholderiaceae bacterium]
MKPQQVLTDFTDMRHAVEQHARRAKSSLPTIAAIAVALASSVVLMLGGCASSAGIAPVAQPIAPVSVGLDSAAPATPPLATDWWRAFGDAPLSDLVDKALAANPSLKVAQARLERARAAVAGAQSAEGLKVNGELNATRQRFSANGIYPPPLGGGIFTIGTAQIGASYEFDFFGKNRAAIEAALGAERAAQADAQAARILLASNVARTYVQLGRLFEQRDVAVRSLKQRDDILALVKQRVQGGLDTNVELRQGEGALPESRQQIEQLDEQIALTRHALAALTAQPPAALDTLVVPLRSVQLVPVPPAVPADLLGRRADIAAARARIEAAGSDVKNAKASFYPNINLTAFVGLNSIGLDRLLRSGSEQYGIGPALTLPIFDAGRLRANLRGKTADLDAAVESYNGAVIDAVHDVADQLSSVRSIERQQVEQRSALASAESAYDLATQRYRAGLGTYLTVLNADTSVLMQRRLGADLKARALDVQLALIRALGGGYADAATQSAAAGE